MRDGWGGAMILRCLAMSAAVAAAPLSAQSETGTRIGGRPAQAPAVGTNAERARIWLERYAECIARRDLKRSNAVIEAPVGLPDAAVLKLIEQTKDSCLSAGDADEMALNATLLRGALYADRLTRTTRRLTPEMIAGRTPDLTAEGQRRTLLRFGDCVVRTDPSASLAYVAMHAASKGEDDALEALKPALGECVGSGDKVKLSRSVIEAALAEVIYRTLKAPVVAEPTSKN